VPRDPSEREVVRGFGGNDRSEGSRIAGGEPANGFRRARALACPRAQTGAVAKKVGTLANLTLSPFPSKRPASQGLADLLVKQALLLTSS
jgi:hypothetical protein